MGLSQHPCLLLTVKRTLVLWSPQNSRWSGYDNARNRKEDSLHLWVLGGEKGRLIVLSESTEFTLELTEFQTRGGDTQRGHRREAPITCRAVSRLLSLPCAPQSGAASQVSPLSYVL